MRSLLERVTLSLTELKEMYETVGYADEWC